jgi:hypothetical protein
MPSSLQYWIPTPGVGRIAIVPRPRGGDWLEEEVKAWRRAGVDVLVSLLTADEIASFELFEEAAVCLAQGVDFRSFPILDRGIQLKNRSAGSSNMRAGLRSPIRSKINS